VIRLSQHRGWRLSAVLVLLVGQASLSAHEVVVEQIVAMTVEPQADRLVVALHVPATAAGDPAIPGLLKNGDGPILEDHLSIVGSDIAHSLDIQQDDVTLSAPTVTVRRGPDGVSIDVVLGYAIAGGGHNFSARLNAFTSKDGPVRTVARYRPVSRREQVVSVTGPAVRIAFDPPTTAVLTSFAVRGLRALFDSGDHLLFLACVLLPLRRPRPMLGLYAAAAIAQAVAMTIFVVDEAVMAAWLPGVAMAAASAIVIAATQNIARARVHWVLYVAAVFGVLNGWSLGQSAASIAQFAGAHLPLAMLAFAAVVLLGELWLAALIWAFRTWLDDRGLPDRIVVLAGSTLVAHRAIHRVMERGEIVAQAGSFGGERAVTYLTLLWIAAILVAAAAKVVWRAPERVHAP
jgi:HupE / UreJ protein